MRTPAGKECRYFYGDYFRGRNHEECRLLDQANERWTPDLCFTCPVPGILQSNACESMILVPKVPRTLPLLKRKVTITARCTKTNRHGFDPHIGCGECHPLPPLFSEEKR